MQLQQDPRDKEKDTQAREQHERDWPLAEKAQDLYQQSQDDHHGRRL